MIHPPPQQGEELNRGCLLKLSLVLHTLCRRRDLTVDTTEPLDAVPGEMVDLAPPPPPVLPLARPAGGDGARVRDVGDGSVLLESEAQHRHPPGPRLGLPSSPQYETEPNYSPTDS